MADFGFVLMSHLSFASARPLGPPFTYNFRPTLSQSDSLTDNTPSRQTNDFYAVVRPQFCRQLR